MNESLKDLIRKEVLAQSGLGDRVPTDDEDLFRSGFLDSLSFMGLLVAIQENFGVSFARAQLRFENFNSINAIVKCVESRKAP